jgi:hypothetical protein
VLSLDAGLVSNSSDRASSFKSVEVIVLGSWELMEYYWI